MRNSEGEGEGRGGTQRQFDKGSEFCASCFLFISSPVARISIPQMIFQQPNPGVHYEYRLPHEHSAGSPQEGESRLRIRSYLMNSSGRHGSRAPSDVQTEVERLGRCAVKVLGLGL